MLQKSIGIHSFYDIYNKNNALFEKESYAIGDDLGVPLILLKEKLKEEKIEINTLDVISKKNYNADILLFLDYPSNIKSVFSNFKSKAKIKELFLIIYESEVIRKKNWQKKNHQIFDKIFTWHDDWLDGQKYIKYYWPNLIPENFKIEKRNNEKFCTLIAGNKTNRDKRELYRKRVEAIRWFEKKHPEDFEFYGVGWEKGCLKPFIASLNRIRLFSIGIKILEKIKLFQKIFRKPFDSYRGKVTSKKEILQKYRFSICYENAKDIPGYITEKIFDCFLAGCIPVYWGAPNVTDFIPESTFIDKRKFKTYEDLYSFMKNMSEETYQNYLRNIEFFLNSEKGKLFSAENFVKTIINEISKG